MKKLAGSDHKEGVLKALRDLVAAIYNDCMGTHGADYRYHGQYEREVQKLAELLWRPKEG